MGFWVGILFKKSNKLNKDCSHKVREESKDGLYQKLAQSEDILIMLRQKFTQLCSPLLFITEPHSFLRNLFSFFILFFQTLTKSLSTHFLTLARLLCIAGPLSSTRPQPVDLYCKWHFLFLLSSPSSRHLPRFTACLLFCFPLRL